jgi:hypothetical protein
LIVKLADCSKTRDFSGIIEIAVLLAIRYGDCFSACRYIESTAVLGSGHVPCGRLDIDETTLAWVADDVPLGLVTLCRLQRDQAGTSSFFISPEILRLFGTPNPADNHRNLGFRITACGFKIVGIATLFLPPSAAAFQ